MLSYLLQSTGESDGVIHARVVLGYDVAGEKQRKGRLRGYTHAMLNIVLQGVLERGSSTVANDVLRMLRRLFDYAVVRGMIEVNSAIFFGLKRDVSESLPEKN